jgi:hypothetical protein
MAANLFDAILMCVDVQKTLQDHSLYSANIALHFTEIVHGLRSALLGRTLCQAYLV